MEVFVLASAIFNLSCLMKMNGFYNNMNGLCQNNDVFIKNVLPLLCMSDGVFPAAAPPAT